MTITLKETRLISGDKSKEVSHTYSHESYGCNSNKTKDDNGYQTIHHEKGKESSDADETRSLSRQTQKRTRDTHL